MQDRQAQVLPAVEQDQAGRHAEAGQGFPGVAFERGDHVVQAGSDEGRGRDRLPLDRAIACGQLPAGTDVPADVDQLVGPVYYRVLVTGEPVGRPFTDRLVDGYLRGLPR